MNRTGLPDFYRIAAGIVMTFSVALVLPAQTGLPPDADLSELVFDDTPAVSPQVPVPAPDPVPDPVKDPVKEKPVTEVRDATPLRDPFWPVGYFPEGWQQTQTGEDPAAMEGAGWKAASAKIRIGGTSIMDGKAAAIVNGKLKVAGDLIEVVHEGRTYQWLISSIDANGQIHLKKQRVR
ncbi:MAG: hypothetical protein MUC65_00205 [Pontiellaceae bacterium]|jgi:hypothetical protein|nr:hypothetical protein [Pontiellaceae bacterium]